MQIGTNIQAEHISPQRPSPHRAPGRRGAGDHRPLLLSLTDEVFTLLVKLKTKQNSSVVVVESDVGLAYFSVLFHKILSLSISPQGV